MLVPLFWVVVPEDWRTVDDVPEERRTDDVLPFCLVWVDVLVPRVCEDDVVERVWVPLDFVCEDVEVPVFVLRCVVVVVVRRVCAVIVSGPASIANAASEANARLRNCLIMLIV